MNRTVKILLILGALLTLVPPFIGLALTTLSMILAFHDLGQNGVSDSQQLSHHIGYALVATAGGLIVSAIGIILLIVAGAMALFARRPENLG